MKTPSSIAGITKAFYAGWDAAVIVTRGSDRELQYCGHAAANLVAVNDASLTCSVCASEAILRAEMQAVHISNSENARLYHEADDKFVALREGLTEFIRKLKRRARTNCDPANGSASAQERGFAEAYIAEELTDLLGRKNDSKV